MRVPAAAGYRTGLRQDLQEGCGLRLGGALKPSERELAENSRSRSAILWVLVKGRGVRVADVEAASYAEMGWGGTRRLRAMCFELWWISSGAVFAEPPALAAWPEHKSDASA